MTSCSSKNLIVTRARADATHRKKMSERELFDAARVGKTEDVRRLLAEKVPPEWKNVPHRPPQKHNPPPGTRALFVAKGGAERA